MLRQRLRGPALAAYYPRRVATFKDFKSLYPGFETFDDFEEDRLEHLQIAKSRGKGAPKKKKSAAGEFRGDKGHRYISEDGLTSWRREQEERQEAEVVAMRSHQHEWSFGYAGRVIMDVQYVFGGVIPWLSVWTPALTQFCTNMDTISFLPLMPQLCLPA